MNLLTHFMPLVPFFNPWKHQVFWCFHVVSKGTRGIKCDKKQCSYPTETRILHWFSRLTGYYMISVIVNKLNQLGTINYYVIMKYPNVAPFPLFFAFVYFIVTPSLELSKVNFNSSISNHFHHYPSQKSRFCDFIVS